LKYSHGTAQQSNAAGAVVVAFGASAIAVLFSWIHDRVDILKSINDSVSIDGVEGLYTLLLDSTPC